MGQQQLLLIVLGVIVVGIAVILGITIFRQNAIDQKRTLITNENITLAMTAIEYYKKPVMLGGGGRSFTGWVVPVQVRNTASGSYDATVFDDHVIITGTGNETVNGTDSVKVQTTVYPDSYTTTIIN